MTPKVILWPPCGHVPTRTIINTHIPWTCTHTDRIITSLNLEHITDGIGHEQFTVCSETSQSLLNRMWESHGPSDEFPELGEGQYSAGVRALAA